MRRRKPILVIDNGTHYRGELERALSLVGVEFSIEQGDAARAEVDLDAASGVILSGGEVHVYRPDQLQEVQLSCRLIEAGSLPILGLCLGCQLLAHVFGGTVEPLPGPVDQPVDVEWQSADPLRAGLPSVVPMLMAHSDAVTDPGPLLVTLARSRFGAHEALRHRTRPLYGIQFHPEVSGTLGRQVLANFVTICNRWADSASDGVAV